MDERILREFVAEALVICANDYDGVTWGLEDKALQAGAELGITKEEMDEIIRKA